MQVTARYLEAWVSPECAGWELSQCRWDWGSFSWHCCLGGSSGWISVQFLLLPTAHMGNLPRAASQRQQLIQLLAFPNFPPMTVLPKVPGMQQQEYIPVAAAFLTTLKESNRAPVLTGKNNFHRRQNSSCTPELETIQGGIFDFPKLSFRNNPSSFIKAVRRGMSYLEGLTLYV